MRKTFLGSLCAVGLAFALCPMAMAVDRVVHQVAPFTGEWSESFEGFDNFMDNPAVYMDSPSSIFGGRAMITGNAGMMIYEPTAGADFTLGSAGDAWTADGLKGLGLDSTDGTIVIDFLNNNVIEFGGSFAAAARSRPGKITFDFYNVRGVLVDTHEIRYVESGDGQLFWSGFRSDVPLDRVEVSGRFLAMDNLQMIVPAPGAIALLGVAGMCARRRSRA